MQDNQYIQHPRYHVAVDCVIFGYEEGVLKLLLYPRGFEPSLGNWSLLGGFVQEKESVEDASRRVLLNTTGLRDIYLQQVSTFSRPDRDPGARVISVVSYALVHIDKYDKELVRDHGAHWWPVDKMPQFIFDHKSMVQSALFKLQQDASVKLVGKELLPDLFTLNQLRSLYGAIFQKDFDPANFRKKILSLGVLEKTSIKNTTESRKGAFCYKFKEETEMRVSDRIVKFI
ncbi:NUDIX hydrolase [Saccharicrinis fermentans]|uniref:Nudix hydrolase domain-containing protein n=1 Tax=Saccharicrinis fermentans DSM 9555 = JCM 21142 TaxID=869213 RepID=W7YKF7_9BACT|nr:NUDIX domain-containing protein [Saccharicrinis fermentans]GAF05006.1 hypothetical protein JCM21142_93729 [Saccharicrinis fermentans DSM 9555 = JCM 21142]